MKDIEIINNSIDINKEEGFIFDNNNLIVNKDSNIFIYITKSDLALNIKILKSLKVEINFIVIDSNITLKYQIDDNSSLIVNNFNVDTNFDIKIDLEEESIITYNYSIVSNINNILIMTINHLKNKSKSYIYNHGINIKELLEFNITAKVLTNIFDCISEQDNKIIYLNEAKSVIYPNLLVENNEIIAKHNAYIGQFNEDDIFYLLTRGINRSKAISLMIKGNLLGNMKEDYKFLSECLKLI
ncbi:MAG: SufD family Fe-S cluster assembly protein [Bacilli bacterium]